MIDNYQRQAPQKGMELAGFCGRTHVWAAEVQQLEHTMNPREGSLLWGSSWGFFVFPTLIKGLKTKDDVVQITKSSEVMRL